MRGIGVGQRIVVYIIPEVRQLIHTQLGCAGVASHIGKLAADHITG